MNSITKAAISAVKLNAKELKTAEPEIVSLPASHFLAPTIEAALSEDGKSIAINQEIEQHEANLFFIISHEMRHLWQMQNGGYITDDYMPSDGQNRTEYNLQKAEVDANAWAIIMCERYLCIRPLLEQALGAEVWEKIKERVKVIKDDRKNIL